MPALTPYPGESPLDFERRRQAQAGNTVAAGIAPAARPAYDAGVAGQLFGPPGGTAPNGSTWTPTVAGGSGSPATTPASWPVAGGATPAGGGALPSWASLRGNWRAGGGDPFAGRLTQSQGLKYDPKLTGGGDVVSGFDPGGMGPAGGNQRQAITGAGGRYQEALDDPNIVRMAVLRRLGINPTGRGYVASRLRDRLPDLYEGWAAMQNLGGGDIVDNDALLGQFAGLYQGGNFRQGLRQSAQNLLGNRALLSDMPLEEAASALKGATQLANYGGNALVGRSRQRGIQDAVSAFLAREEETAAGGGELNESGLWDFLQSPEGATWARRLGLA